MEIAGSGPSHRQRAALKQPVAAVLLSCPPPFDATAFALGEVVARLANHCSAVLDSRSLQAL